MKKRKRISSNSVANTFTIWLLFCAIAFSVVLYIQTASTQRYIKDKIADIEIAYAKINSESENMTDTQISEMQGKYFEYCNAIDQQFDDSFNKLLAFFSCIFGVTTIVNAYTAYRLPKIQEDKLKEIDIRMNDVEQYVKEADFFARIASMGVADKSIKEKIDEITDFIDKSCTPSYNLFFTRGSLYYDIKEYKKAEDDYKKAKNQGMPLSMFHNAMGVLYSEIMLGVSGDNKHQKKDKYFKTSKEHYKEAIELYKKEGKQRKLSSCLCNLACLYQDNGLSEKAMEYFEKAIDADNSNAVAYFDRAISYEEMGHEHYEDALADYDKCLEINPYFNEARQYRAELAIKMYECFGDSKYLNLAQKDCQKLSGEAVRLSRLQERINRNNLSASRIDDLVAKIDEKIADLSVEEAHEHEIGSEEYIKYINDAKEHYSSARKYYENMYHKTSNDTYKEAIERIDSKLHKI